MVFEGFPHPIETLYKLDILKTNLILEGERRCIVNTFVMLYSFIFYVYSTPVCILFTTDMPNVHLAYKLAVVQWQYWMLDFTYHACRAFILNNKKPNIF